jgi:ribosome-associated heat shock protein Hsp15
METVNQIRIDKFLWAVRLFKTRSLAADACKSGKILIHGYPVKSSRLISVNEVFTLRKNPIIYTYKIKEILSNRVGPKLVENYLENLTPPEELLKLEIDIQSPFVKRDRGAGRPTKKERREIDKLNPIS